MALGTPVAAATAYNATAGGTTVTPAYPAGILATDVVLLFVGQKPSTANGGTVTTPTGWTLREELTGAGGYGATLGADTGNTNLRVYSWNTPVAGQTGNLTVTLGTNNISWAFMVRIPSGGGALSYGSADGQRTTAPTVNVAFATALTNGTTATAFKTGDRAIWAMCIPTDVTTPGQFSAQSVTATGATFGAATELNEPDSGTGTDIGGYSAWAAVTAGSSTTAPTVTVTATGTVTNVRGPIVLLRVRELPEINAEVGSFTYTGQDTDLAATRNINAEAGTFSYTGQDAELIKTAAPKEINAEAGTFSYTGQDATLARNFNINAEAGTFAYTGQDATLTAVRSVNAEAGSFSYTGQNATLSRAYSFNAEAGAYNYTGQNATLARSLSVNAEAGTFSYTGQTASMQAARSLNAGAGSFAYVGQAATLAQARNLNAEAGSFAYVGQDAEFVYTQVRGIDAQAGTFAYTGQDATLNRNYSFNAEAGSFAIVGQDATLQKSFNANAEAGAFAYTGQDATLAVSGAFNAEAGSFSITGQDATLAQTRSFNAEAGAFTYTGQAATLAQGRNFNAEVGSFDYIGQQASLTRTRSFDAQAGSFTYTGQPTTFNQTRVLKADAAAFGEANPYVDPGYVEPYYSTNLTAALGYGRMFSAEAGIFVYTGQLATFAIQSLYPPESDVRQGVVYGPGGMFVGTLVPTGAQIFLFDD